jgi:hypothetical protein
LSKLEEKGFEVSDLKQEIFMKAKNNKNLAKDDIDHSFPPPLYHM